MTETSNDHSCPADSEAAQVHIARAIATRAHEGQTDKLGAPYIEHPRRVATSLDDSLEQAVGWLHDVIEDCRITEGQLRAAGLDEQVVYAVGLLTRRDEVPDEQYYARIRQNPLARAVKLADIADNTLAWRTERLPGELRQRLAHRYAKARAALGVDPVEQTDGSRQDRAAGAILGMAAGDALGAPYEFKAPSGPETTPEMTGGGDFGWEPGEWTDDTSMAVPILRALSAGKSLEHETTLDGIVAEWISWASTAKDVGTQTRHVLSTAAAPTAAAAREAARQLHEQKGRSAGNGSLMRTAPVALRHLDDEEALIAAARRMSELTHFEEDAGDACVLWCLAIRQAILAGELDLRRGIRMLPVDRQERWHGLLDEAELKTPADFAINYWVVQALQGAWSAITSTAVPRLMPGRHLKLALEAAVRGGHDADTVAAIAGSLLGARWGASAIPSSWKRKLHGWPGLHTSDLASMAVLAVRGGRADGNGWPTVERLAPTLSTLVRHPHDTGVWLGALGALDTLPTEIDAVVSLCRVGSRQTDRESVGIWLIDQPGHDRNPNLDLVLIDAADAVAQLRAEGRTVLVHCFEARSRTPSVGALYSALHLGVPVEQALADVVTALPDGAPAPFLTSAVRRIAAARIPVSGRTTTHD